MSLAAAPVRSSNAAPIGARVTASLLGGYGFTLGLVSLGTAGGVALGMPYDQARTLMHLLAALVFLIVFCWAFVARSVPLVWAVLGGGGALMTGAAWWLAHGST